MSRALNADTTFCGGKLIWEREAASHCYDDFDNMVRNAMKAFRSAGAMMINLHSFFWNKQAPLFGHNMNETCWPIKNTPQATSTMKFMVSTSGLS